MPVINAGKKFGGGGSNIDGFERLMAALNYLTVGLSGLIYTIIQGKYCRTHFFRFHFLQSIVLGIFYLLLSMTSSVFVNIVGGMLQLIPGVGPGALMVIPVALDWILKVGSLVLVYGLVMSLMGKEAPLPVVSKIVYQQLR